MIEKSEFFKSFFFIAIAVIVNVEAQYDMTIKDFEIMVPKDQKFLNIDKLQLKRINRTHPHFLIGEFEFFVDVGNDYEIEGVLFKMEGSNMEYRPTPYSFRRKFCEYVDWDRVFYPDYVKTTTLPKETCPLPKGRFRIRGYSPNFENLPPYLESGEYAARMTFYKNGKVVQGAKVFITGINKYPTYQLLGGRGK